jgi:hypothetical protein
MDLITPMVAGAAGAFVKEIAHKGVDWLIQIVGSHSYAVQQQTKENVQNFLVRLAERVERLEAEIPTENKFIFEDALCHPSSSLLIQKAMVAAAITDNDDRHEILSELIAQRLTAGADDMIALVGAAACDVVSALSSKHIKLLALMARIFKMKPIGIPITNDQDEYDRYVLSWFRDLEILRAGLENINMIDFEHLEALSCISFPPIIREINLIFSIPIKPKQLQPTFSLIKSENWWPTLDNLFKIGLFKNSQLTSIGALIGIIYHDKILKNRTILRWE